MRTFLIILCLTSLIAATGCMRRADEKPRESISVNSADKPTMDLTPGPVIGELLPTNQPLISDVPTPILYKLDEAVSHAYLLPDNKRVIDQYYLGPGTKRQLGVYIRRYIATTANGWKLETQRSAGSDTEWYFNNERSEELTIRLTEKVYNEERYTVMHIIVLPENTTVR